MARGKLCLQERIGKRFEPVSITPRRIVEELDCDDDSIKGIRVGNTLYRPTERFYKTLASEMGIPFGVFVFFTPLEVMTRAAEKSPDMPLRMTIDTSEGKVLGLTQNKGVPMPIRFIENVLHDDGRLQEIWYSEKV